MLEEEAQYSFLYARGATTELYTRGLQDNQLSRNLALSASRRTGMRPSDTLEIPPGPAERRPSTTASFSANGSGGEAEDFQTLCRLTAAITERLRQLQLQ